ncbi:alpha/beta hydrolase [Kribbella capetownensis]|uniref:alpha/beta hydrolase n=1 Tax=Kribbella capetownensis TaxID=1572659 RepID=UPI001EDF2089|nr:hypothetical protein [Kribbella capetownensis]
MRESERAIHEAARVEVVDGVVTYAWGDGRRPVLLVHGWRSRASRYAGFVARLLELGYSPVSFDAPGHGDTPCRELGLGPETNKALRRSIERGYFDGDEQIWARFSVAAADADLLVIHNDEDDVVDPQQVRVLLRAYGPRAHFLATTGLGHRRIMTDPEVITEAVAFLQDARVSDVAEGLDLSA